MATNMPAERSRADTKKVAVKDIPVPEPGVKL
jgi:hypothetical protein